MPFLQLAGNKSLAVTFLKPQRLKSIVHMMLVSKIFCPFESTSASVHALWREIDSHFINFCGCARALWLFTPLLLALVFQPAGAATAFVEGEASYREGIQPPQGAALIVTLEDVSRADAKSLEVASSRRLISGAPPHRWRIDYETSAVAPGRRWVLRARIVTPDGLWMTTDTVVTLPVDSLTTPTLSLVPVVKPSASQIQTPAGGTTPDCASAITQAEMTRCAHEEFLAASQIYAQRYAALAVGLSAAQRSRLQQMQKRWIDYRTAACLFESGASFGGSAQPQANWLCAARMTRDRAEALSRYANCPEGDITCNYMQR